MLPSTQIAIFATLLRLGAASEGGLHRVSVYVPGTTFSQIWNVLENRWLQVGILESFFEGTHMGIDRTVGLRM